MTVEKRLLLNYGYIREGFCRIFDFINYYEIISASSGLIGFSNISKSSVTRRMKQWTNDVKKALSQFDEKILLNDINFNLCSQYKNEFKTFSKRLDDFCITDVNSYLEIVQKAIQENQNNTEVYHCLNMIEDAIKKKKIQIEDLLKMINEQFSDLNTDKNEQNNMD